MRPPVPACRIIESGGCSFEPPPASTPSIQRRNLDLLNSSYDKLVLWPIPSSKVLRFASSFSYRNEEEESILGFSKFQRGMRGGGKKDEAAWDLRVLISRVRSPSSGAKRLHAYWFFL